MFLLEEMHIYMHENPNPAKREELKGLYGNIFMIYKRNQGDNGRVPMDKNFDICIGAFEKDGALDKLIGLTILWVDQTFEPVVKGKEKAGIPKEVRAAEIFIAKKRNFKDNYGVMKKLLLRTEVEAVLSGIQYLLATTHPKNNSNNFLTESINKKIFCQIGALETSQEESKRGMARNLFVGDIRKRNLIKVLLGIKNKIVNPTINKQ